MLTPETLHEELLVELNRSLADAAASAHPHRHAFRVRRQALRQRLPPAGALALAGVAGACAIAATVVLVARWPPGGGEGIGQLAVAQGASLVFVALLLSLLPGVVDAGRSIGWEPAWILRDRLTWLGFGAVALLSVGDLTVAWAQPEHVEEGATILMTASGLAITGLLARRLLRMSDPGEQLDARVKAQVPKLIAILTKESRRAARRAAEHGVGEDSARLLTLTPHPGAQAGMAGVIRAMLGLSARYVQDSRWDQALKAFEVSTRTVVAYVQAGKRMHLQDSVLQVFGDRTNDLHELSGGPEGRDLSLALLRGISRVGEAIAASHLEHGVREGGPLHRLGFMTDLMVRRRVTDESSPDPAAGLELIGELAVAAAQVGDGASATSIADALLRFAVPAMVARQSHIAGPAWGSAVRVLGALALVREEARDTAALELWADSFAGAVGSLPNIPFPVGFSGAEPLLTNEPSRRSLMFVVFTIWASGLDTDAKTYVDGKMADALARPMRASTGNDHGALEVVVEVWHQFASATANSAERDPDARPVAVDALARHLARVREAWLLDTRNFQILHVYVTCWVLTVFVTRSESELPLMLVTELEAFGASVVGLQPPVDPRVAEALLWISQAMRRAIRKEEADLLAAWVAEGSVTASGRLYRLGRGRRRLHSGLLTTAIVAQAQAWWLDVPSGS
jgi:hypothetical protein